MSAISYRDAAADDAAPLAAFSASSFAATFGHLYPAEDLETYVSRKYFATRQAAEIADAATRYRLALRDDAIVGYCKTGALGLPVEPDSSALELHRLYVDDSVKGAGVARTLMDHALDWARAQRARAMYLSVWEKNLRAQAFYRRYGFEHVSEWDFMVGRVRDRDFIWRLRL